MKSIFAAFVKAQKEFGPALKTSTNPHFKSRYADLAACVEAVIDALNANGIAMIQKSHESETGVAIETVFLHESGETISSGILKVPAQKNDPQGYGSALTYARRYSLMAACGIAPEDDDGNAAQKARPAPPKAAPAPTLDNEDMDDLKQLAKTLTQPVEGENNVSSAYDMLVFNQLDNEKKRVLWAMLSPATKKAISAEKLNRAIKTSAAI